MFFWFVLSWGLCLGLFCPCLLLCCWGFGFVRCFYWLCCFDCVVVFEVFALLLLFVLLLVVVGMVCCIEATKTPQHQPLVVVVGVVCLSFMIVVCV